MLRDGGEPVVRGLGERLLRREEEVRVGALATATDPAAELVQLGQAEQVGPLDDQRVRVRDVDAGLDDRRTDDDVGLLLPEALDDLLELVLGHLAVGHRDAGLRDELADPGGRLLDRVHPVVDEEDLTLAEQLAPDRGGHLAFLVGADEGQHRVPLLRRGGDGGHLPDAGDRHLQGARDRRRGHGQHVDSGPQLLQLLLVLDTEALLLVDDHQAEILELDLAAEQPVGTDHHVNRAVGQTVQGRLGFLVGLEARQRRHVHRERRVALGERRVVLLHQQGGRHQYSDLLAVLGRLEGSPYGDLGLAVADVTADDPVHRRDEFHVVLHVVDGGQLVGRLHERERVLQLTLPGGVLGERVSLGRLARGVQLDQLAA